MKRQSTFCSGKCQNEMFLLFNTSYILPKTTYTLVSADVKLSEQINHSWKKKKKSKKPPFQALCGVTVPGAGEMWCCGCDHHPCSLCRAWLEGRGFSGSHQQQTGGRSSFIHLFFFWPSLGCSYSTALFVCVPGSCCSLEAGQNSHWLNWEQHQAKDGYFYLSLLPLHLLPPPPSPWVRGNELCFSFPKVSASSEQEPCQESLTVCSKGKGERGTTGIVLIVKIQLYKTAGK